MSDPKLIGFKSPPPTISSPQNAQQSVIVGGRPHVEKLIAQIRMTKPVAQQLFPSLIWGENEHDFDQVGYQTIQFDLK